MENQEFFDEVASIFINDLNSRLETVYTKYGFKSSDLNFKEYALDKDFMSYCFQTAFERFGSGSEDEWEFQDPGQRYELIGWDMENFRISVEEECGSPGEDAVMINGNHWYDLRGKSGREYLQCMFEYSPLANDEMRGRWLANKEKNSIAAALSNSGSALVVEKTLLHYASGNGSDDVVELLIKEGADVNAMDSAGNTPLHHAAMSERKNTVSLLVQGGANVSAVNKDGKTARDLAKSETLKSLLMLAEEKEMLERERAVAGKQCSEQVLRTARSKRI